MIPVLFKKDEQQFRNYGLGPIHDIINPKVTRERNGQYLLYFQYPQDAKFSDVFAEEMRIKSDAGVRTKWQTFEISRVVRKEGQLIEVFAKHISQSLLKDALRPSVNIRNANAQQALGTWNNSRIGDEDFDVWSDITTVSSTSWSIQDVSNAFEALAGVQGSILDVWGGEYEFDNKLIRLHKEMGRKSPVPLEYGRNVTGLEQDIQDDTVYTSIYPFATYTKEGASEPTIVTLPEYYVDGKYINMHSKRKIQVVDFSGEFEPDDIPTVSRLRTLATQYAEANEVGAPHENIKIEYIDLAKTLDYKDFQTMEEVELNDRLPIFYPKFGITNENAKVVVVNYDPVKEENISIELGIIGQSFRTVTTGGIGSRLDRIEQEQKETKKYIVNAEGNRIWFETPDEDIEHKIGDTWFEKNGPYERIRVWNGSQWEIIIDTEDIDKIAKEVAQQQLELDEVKQTAEEAVDRINGEIANKFTDIEVELVNIEELSNTAYTNALTSLDHSLDAQMLASQAFENTSGLSVRVDDVENELTIKADKQTVDDLENIVNLQALDIKANSDGLALKANQDTVDLLSGTVSSLGTDVGIVAGQVNSRVWNTDIETAIDGLSYENRNLVVRNNEYSDTWLNQNGGMEANVGHSTMKKHIQVTPNEVLTFTKTYSEIVLYPGFWRFNWYDKDGKYLSRRAVSDNEFQWIVPDNAYSILVSYPSDSSPKLEKGSKATPWSPAPEDTLARFDHIETEWTQTFDSFTQSVAHIDGRVTSVRQDVDSMAGTVANHTGKIASIEFNISGMQGIISDPVNGLVTQVSALAGGFNVLASDFENLEIGGRNLIIQSRITRGYYLNNTGSAVAHSSWFYTDYIPVSEYKHLVTSGYTNLGNSPSTIYYDSSKSYVKGMSSRGQSNSKLIEEIDSGIAYIRFSGEIKDLPTLKLEKGTKATDWSPAPEDMATQAQFSVLNDNINMRVSKGELLSQINIEAGRTLIQSDRLYLDASSVVFSGNAFIPSAAIQNLTADKITVGTLNGANVRVINLDASSIVSGRIEGIEIIAKFGEIGDWNLNAGVLYSQTRNNLNTTIKATGEVAFAAGAPEPRNTSGATFQLWHSGRLRWLNRSGETAGDIEVIGNQTFLSMHDATFSRINLPRSGFIGLASNGELSIQNSGSLYINPGTLTYFVGDIRPSSNGNYHVGGANHRWKAVWTVDGVNESSDERLKKNIKTLDASLLERVEDVKPIMYEDQNGKISFGYSAQDVQRTLTQYAYQELGMRESEVLEKFSVLEKGESYLSLRYRDIEVMKGALRDKKIEELEKRIEELENAG